VFLRCVGWAQRGAQGNVQNSPQTRQTAVAAATRVLRALFAQQEVVLRCAHAQPPTVLGAVVNLRRTTTIVARAVAFVLRVRCAQADDVFARPECCAPWAARQRVWIHKAAHRTVVRVGWHVVQVKCASEGDVATTVLRV
jgi:hypothetical protein